MAKPEDADKENHLAPGTHTIIVDEEEVEYHVTESGYRAVVPRTVVRLPGVVGGEPIIEETRIPVKAIALMSRLYPETRDVLRALPTLYEDDVHTALSYYAAHREEIDGYIAADARSDDEPL